MAGQNPYDMVGPGRAVEWSFPLLYPFTAVMLVAPLALLPVPQAWFSGASIAIFVWAITSRREFRFAAFALATFTVFHAAKMVQWSPLLIGGALLPVWGFVLACKPTIGGALWIAYPNRSVSRWKRGAARRELDRVAGLANRVVEGPAADGPHAGANHVLGRAADSVGVVEVAPPGSPAARGPRLCASDRIHV